MLVVIGKKVVLTRLYSKLCDTKNTAGVKETMAYICHECVLYKIQSYAKKKESEHCPLRFSNKIHYPQLVIFIPFQRLVCDSIV